VCREFRVVARFAEGTVSVEDRLHVIE